MRKEGQETGEGGRSVSWQGKEYGIGAVFGFPTSQARFEEEEC